MGFCFIPAVVTTAGSCQWVGGAGAGASQAAAAVRQGQEHSCSKHPDGSGGGLTARPQEGSCRPAAAGRADAACAAANTAPAGEAVTALINADVTCEHWTTCAESLQPQLDRSNMSILGITFYFDDKHQFRTSWPHFNKGAYCHQSKSSLRPAIAMHTVCRLRGRLLMQMCSMHTLPRPACQQLGQSGSHSTPLLQAQWAPQSQLPASLQPTLPPPHPIPQPTQLHQGQHQLTGSSRAAACARHSLQT